MATIQKHTLFELADHLNKTYGDNTCLEKKSMVMFDKKLPTGIFALDFALNGGLALNRIACFKGLESGGKSSAAMNVGAIAAKMCWRCFNIDCICSEPKLTLKVLWCDVEGTFDSEWAEAIGMEPNSYLIAYGDDGEQCADIIEAGIRSTDCGLVIVDSVAAMTPSKIIEGSAYDQFVGVDPRFITPFVKRVRSRLVREAKLGHPIVCIMINQARYKIGELYGPNTTMPGGQALKHETSVWVNFSKRAPTDTEKKMADDKRSIARAQRHHFIIEKHKQSILAGAGEFVRCKEDIYTDDALDYKKGDILDHKSTMKYGKDYNIITQDNNKWSYGNITGSQKTIIETWKQDDNLYLKAQQEIINAARKVIAPLESC
jgi:recombination protein RecA